MRSEDLCARYPQLFHMAEPESWRGIVARGLLSTSALLDLYGVSGERREAIESRRRPRKVTLSHPGLEDAVVRDQIPLDDTLLAACLTGGMTIREWYHLINRKVFFWAERFRLRFMMGAPAYVGDEHLVITIETELFVSHHGDRVTLSAINSGSTYRVKTTGAVAPRGPDTFLPVSRFPSGPPVVELAVERQVEDVRRFATRAAIMKCPAKDAEPVLVREVWSRN